MAWNKLSYVKNNPQLAYARIAPSGFSADLHKNEAGDRWVMNPKFQLNYGGINWAQRQLFPSPAGPIMLQAVIPSFRYDDGGTYKVLLGEIFALGGAPTTGPDPHWTGDYPIFAVLVRGNIDATGAGQGVFTNVRTVYLIEGWAGMSGDNAIEEIRELFNNGIIIMGGGITVELLEIAGIFKMFDNVDGFTESQPTYNYALSKDWRFEPTDTWPETTAGTGVNIEVADGWKRVYFDAGYTLEDLGGGMFGAMAAADGIMGSAVGIADIPWTAEWDYDVTDCISTHPKIGAPPMGPLAIWGAMNIEGVAGAIPLFGGSAVGIGIGVGNDGLESYVFSYSGSGGTPSGEVPAVGRFKILFDGIDHYYFYYSENDGETWVAITDFTDTLPVDYATHDAMFRILGLAFSTGQTIDIKTNAIQVKSETGTYMADAYRPLQNGDNGWGYIMDRLGFTDGVNNYRGVTGITGPIDGHNNSRLRDPGPPIDFRMLNNSSDGNETYEVEMHSIVPFCTGSDNVWAIAVNVPGMGYITFCVNELEKELFKTMIGDMGATVDGEFKVFQNNGINIDYTYVGPGPIPPTPPTPSEGRAGAIDFSGIDKELQDDIIDIQY